MTVIHGRYSSERPESGGTLRNSLLRPKTTQQKGQRSKTTFDQDLLGDGSTSRTWWGTNPKNRTGPPFSVICSCPKLQIFNTQSWTPTGPKQGTTNNSIELAQTQAEIRPSNFKIFWSMQIVFAGSWTKVCISSSRYWKESSKKVHVILARPIDYSLNFYYTR